MASSSNSRSLKYNTDYSTRSQSVVDRMNDIYYSFKANNNVSNFTIIHELWPRFSTISPVNFNSIFSPQPCILAGVNVQPRGVLKQLSDKPDLTWVDFEKIPDYPLINITKGPEYSVTRKFTNSMQRDMDFADCLTCFSFTDQIVTSCVGLLVQGPWFSYAHIEVGGGASYALLHTGIKIWCTTTTNSSSRLLERCCNKANIFIDFFQRVPREKEVNYSRFTIQRSEDLICFPSLRPHAVLTLNTGKPIFYQGGTLLLSLTRPSLQGHWTNTIWGFDVAPGGRFYGHRAEKHCGIGCLLQRWVLKHPRNSYANTGTIGRLIVRTYLRIYLINSFV